jgi:hypothetical protein
MKHSFAQACFTEGGVEVGRCDVIHGGVPKGGDACPLGGAPHGIGDGQ